MPHHPRSLKASTLFFGFLLLNLGRFSLGQEPAGSRPSAASPGLSLAGRVVDPQGHPLPMAQVTVGSVVMGGCLGGAWAAMTEQTTDADGRFSIRVPFADIRYMLTISKSGFRYETINLLKSDDSVVQVQLRRDEALRTVNGRVTRDGDQPASGATVKAVGYYGWTAETPTDERGMFRLVDVPECQDQFALFARAGGLVSPLEWLSKDRQRSVVIRLGPPAEIRGKVVELDSEKGLPAVVVQIAARPPDGFRLQAVSGSDGDFVVPEVPPGNYVIQAITETTHFDRPPRGSSSDRREFAVEAGQTVNRLVEMLECARIRGRVTGRDGRAVSDAVVGTRCSWTSGDERRQGRFVRTGHKGEFELVTGHLATQLDVWAFSPRHGLAKATVEGLREGETREGVDLRLPGAIHIRGRVIDPAGNPIPDVTCNDLGLVEVSHRTDAAGRFDLGCVPIHTGPKAEQYLICYAPRTHGAEPILPRYYLHKKVNHERVPGDLDLEITLEPTEWLTISGTITDQKGALRPGIGVRLFDSAASNYDDLSQDGPDEWRSYSHGGINLDFPLATARTDEHGVFAFKLLRETPESLRISKGGLVDGTGYKIVVDREVRKGVERASQVIENVVVPPGRKDLQVPIRLEPPNFSVGGNRPIPDRPQSAPATAPTIQQDTDLLIYP
jgi:hypothetical protein